MPLPDLASSTPAEIAPLAFVLGRWENGDSSEQWTAVGDLYWGVGFGPGKDGSSFDVMRIEHDGVVQFVGQPKGNAPTPFPRVSSDATSVTFLNPAHDDPQRIRYTLKAKKLVAAIGPTEGPDFASWKYHRAPPEHVAVLEDADRAFAVDVAARGVDAWIDVFDPQGHQWDDRNAVAIPVGEPMREHMAGVLSGKLVWEPVASGLAPAGDLGFTVGTWTWTGEGGEGHGSYVTVWRKQADGSWKVLYDGGS